MKLKRKAGEASQQSGGRRCLRWIANGLIIAGVLAVPLYFLGSCGYTWLEQRGLRQEMAENSPHLTADVFALMERAQTFSTSAVAGQTETAAQEEVPGNAAEESGAETAVPETINATETSEPDPQAQRLAELADFREAAKAFDRSVKAGEPIGRLVIPAIDLDVVMVEGTGKTDLKEGPGHWPETPFPGGGGNFVVSGHRTTYGAPFLHLDDLESGDDIYVVLPYVLVQYRVTDVFVVYPDEVETVAQRGKEQISLAACHPLYSARQRIVAQGDLVEFVLLE